jgi:RNA polymerase sigma-70 factor (ECF subfamily)
MPDDLESSIDLVLKAQSGDAAALEELLARYLPRLQRWASGRMPIGIRSMNDTGDIVQDAVIRSLRNLNSLQIKTEGDLQAYLRKAIRNRIIDEIRRYERRPQREQVPENAIADCTDPLEAVIGAEMLAAYERALEGLSDEERQAIILKVELHLTYEEIARQLDKPTPAAARMAVTRALKRLAATMRQKN